MRLFGVTCTVGTGESEVKGKTVGEIIENLCILKGSEFKKSIYKKGTRKISNQYIILVNSEMVDIKSGLDRKVKKGDMVSIMPDMGPCC
ncbi:MAG: MoaD/ThiS family protein [Methanobacteriota archaeon]